MRDFAKASGILVWAMPYVKNAVWSGGAAFQSRYDTHPLWAQVAHVAATAVLLTGSSDIKPSESFRLVPFTGQGDFYGILLLKQTWLDRDFDKFSLKLLPYSEERQARAESQIYEI